MLQVRFCSYDKFNCTYKISGLAVNFEFVFWGKQVWKFGLCSLPFLFLQHKLLQFHSTKKKLLGPGISGNFFLNIPV